MKLSEYVAGLFWTGFLVLAFFLVTEKVNRDWMAWVFLGLFFVIACFSSMMTRATK